MSNKMVMNDMEIMEQFLNSHYHRKELRNVVNIGDYLYAINGYFLIRKKGLLGRELIEPPFSLDTINKNISRSCEATEPIDIAALESFLSFNECEYCSDDESKVNFRICPECGGNGDVYFNTNHHHYWFVCKSCDGAGSVGNIRKTDECDKCGGIRYNGEPFPFIGSFCSALILKKLSIIPDIKFKYIGKDIYVFQGGGFDGVFMSMQANDRTRLRI